MSIPSQGDGRKPAGNRPTTKRPASSRNTSGRNTSGRPATNRPAVKRTSSANGRPANSRPVRRRRKPSNPNTYLYAALAMGIVGLILFGVLIYAIVGSSGGSSRRRSGDDDDDDRDTPIVESSVSGDTSADISSDSSDISDNTSEDSSVPDVSQPDKPLSVEESIKKYEEYIGVEYSVDMTEYEKFVCPEDAEKFVFLVNPSHPLSSDFVPENLVWCTNIREGRPKEWSYMDGTANKALEAFLAEAAHYGYDDITVTNAYRSYKSQSGLFNGYVASDIKEDYFCDHCKKYIDYSYYPNKVTTVNYCVGCGSEVEKVDGEFYCEICMMNTGTPESQKCCATCKNVVRRPTESETTAHVLTYSTRPGTSEHQSGLCCDMHNLSATTSAFDNTPEAKWLAANAHRFGFILRYPPNTQHITGIKYESWHFRFVGRDAATEMYEKGLTLEEYLGAV